MLKRIRSRAEEFAVARARIVAQIMMETDFRPYAASSARKASPSKNRTPCCPGFGPAWQQVIRPRERAPQGSTIRYRALSVVIALASINERLMGFDSVVPVRGMPWDVH